MANDEDRRAHEAELVQRFAENLSLEDFARWQTLRTGHRVSTHHNAVLILWKAKADGSPEILSWFTVTNLGIGLDGMRIDLTDRYGERTSVTNQPVALHPAVFVWAPFYNEVRRLPNSKDPRQMIIRTAIAMRIKSHQLRWIAGDVYLTPVGEFRVKWPQYKDQRF